MAVARSRPDVEIVSVDSMQVYRGMDIGTAKPTAADRAEVPHHLLDLVDPWESFDVATFQAAFRRALADIEGRGHHGLLVGGTGLYHRAVIDDLDIPAQYPTARAALDAEPDTPALHRRLAALDPVAARRMQPTNRRRVLRALEVTVGSGRPFSSYGPGLGTYPQCRFALVGLAVAPAQASAGIANRLGRQMADGFLEEVRRLAVLPRPLSATAAQALGYRELLAHIRGELSLADAVGLAERRTRQFARRQRAWFRRDPRVEWVDVDDEPMRAVAAVQERLAKAPPPRDAVLRE